MVLPVRQHYVDNAPTQSLSAGVTNSAVTIPLISASGLPSSFPYRATIDLGTASAEQVQVTAGGGLNLTVQRNANGQGAFSHLTGATFNHTANAMDFDEANAHVSATSGVHGITGAVVGTSDVQTLTNKTITGSMVTVAAAGGTPGLIATAAAGSDIPIEVKDSTTAIVAKIDGTGAATVRQLLATSTDPASLASTTQALQLGPTASTNLVADQNEIQARNNGAASVLILNQNGGGINLAKAGDTVHNFGNSTVDGNATVAGTLGVAGAVSLAGALGVTGATSASTVTTTGDINGGANLRAGSSQHITIAPSTNSIQAFDSVGAAADLTLNQTGGNVNVGKSTATVNVPGNLKLTGAFNDSSSNPRYQAGSQSVSFTASSTKTQAVTFPTAFTNIPIIVCEVVASAGQTIGAATRVTSATTTGFSVIVDLTASQTLTLTVNWIAIGT